MQDNSIAGVRFHSEPPLLFIKTEKKKASVGVLSDSQAKHFAIQYSSELIWNKPHLRPEGDALLLLPLNSFLCQHSSFHHLFLSIWTSFSLKVQLESEVGQSMVQ